MRSRIALVTGGSRGIGRSIVEELLASGFQVAFTHQPRNHETLLDRDPSPNCSSKALALEMSLENVSSISETVSQVERRLGPIDVLINNAAIAQEKDFMTLSVEDWDRMLAINLRGPFLFSQQCVQGMIDRGWGRIINISSIGGQWGGVNQVHYAASKAALINLTKSLARLYSSKGVLSNAVAVGLVQSDMSKRELESPEGIVKAKNIPCGRVGDGGDVAKVVTFLSGEASNYVTGQTINVNGGMLFS